MGYRTLIHGPPGIATAEILDTKTFNAEIVDDTFDPDCSSPRFALNEEPTESSQITSTVTNLVSTVSELVGLNENSYMNKPEHQHKEEHPTFPFIYGHIYSLVVIILILTTLNAVLLIVMYVRSRQSEQVKPTESDSDTCQRPEVVFNEVCTRE